MRKVKFKIEYPLNNASIAILWNSIATDYGLSEWFADDVNSDGNTFSFRWSDHVQQATLLHSKQNSFVRFQWDDDNGTEAFFEMRILSSEFSNDLILQVIDYTDKGEEEDAILLWNQQIDELKRVTGIG